jgi:hypothetical protein
LCQQLQNLFQINPVQSALGPQELRGGPHHAFRPQPRHTFIKPFSLPVTEAAAKISWSVCHLKKVFIASLIYVSKMMSKLECLSLAHFCS